MKELRTLVLISFALIAVGCTQLDRALYDEEVREIPGEAVATNTILKTNRSVFIGVNADGTPKAPVIEEAVQPVEVVTYAPATTITNLVPRATIDAALKTTGALPFPYAGTAALVAGWLYTAYANLRNKRVGAALVTSVEAAREVLKVHGAKIDEEFTRKLREQQGLEGVWPQIHKLVQKHT